jgi:hypothetical protein
MNYDFRMNFNSFLNKKKNHRSSMEERPISLVGGNWIKTNQWYGSIA